MCLRCKSLDICDTTGIDGRIKRKGGNVEYGLVLRKSVVGPLDI